MKLSVIFLSLALVFAEEPKPTNEKEHDHHKSQVLHNLLHKKEYDRFVRPNDGVSPVTVNVSMYFSHMTLEKNEWKMIFYLRQYWHDARLSQVKGEKSLTFNADDIISRIWKPDTFFPGATDKLVLQNGFVRIDSGAVIWSQRLKMKSACRKSIAELFANDGLVSCTLAMESYGLSENDIKYKFLNDKSVMVDAGAGQGSFNVTVDSLKDLSQSLSTGNYSRLEITFTIQTIFRKHMFEYLTPEALHQFV